MNNRGGPDPPSPPQGLGTPRGHAPRGVYVCVCVCLVPPPRPPAAYTCARESRFLFPIVGACNGFSGGGESLGEVAGRGGRLGEEEDGGRGLGEVFGRGGGWAHDRLEKNCFLCIGTSENGLWIVFINFFFFSKLVLYNFFDIW